MTWLLGTNVGERYEIYQTTNLLGTSVWNSIWSRVATGGVSFTLSHPTNDGAKAFFLAATYADVDGDGISDAYEYLVLRATNLWDFDSDGMPDFWEIAHGLNYTNRSDATNDLDGDGIKNLSEYLYEASLINPVEPIGPSSRRTPLIISEIMYHPAPGGTEFIELHNTHHLPQKLDGFRFIDNSDGSVLFTFTNTTLAPSAFLSVTLTNLPSPAELQLRNKLGAVLLQVDYSDKTPWPKAADGTGHSLVLSRPSYGENDVRAWSPSARVGGSPGGAEPVVQDFKAAVRINEFLASPAGTNMDFIELYNASSVTQDLSGWHLATKATNLTEYTFPAGTLLPPRAPQRTNLAELCGWMVAHLDADLSVMALAARMAMSPRHFARVFRAELGVTPARFVEALRIEAARRWLERGTHSVETVAGACGLGASERLRRAFLRRLGVNPRDYRNRFETRSSPPRATSP